MRIVAVADTHTFQDSLEVPGGDVFVHAGDMLRGGTLEELEPVAEWIRSLPHRHKVIVAGNHDRCFERDVDRDQAIALLGTATYVEDALFTIDDVTFYGSPWQPAYHDWAFNLPRGEALAAKWAQIPTGVDVLVTHGPAHGHGDRGPYPQRAGCEDLLRRVKEVRPRLHLFGHIHQDGGITEDVDGSPIVFANVTTWECERGATVIDLHPDRLEVISAPPSPRYG